MALAAVLSPSSVFAEEQVDEKGTIQSDQFFGNNRVVSNTGLVTMAQRALAQHHYDKAIAIARSGLQRNHDDLDLHMVYAEALEEKLTQQAGFDESVFRECLREWLIVMRSNLGEERGINILGFGGGDSFWADNARFKEARAHIKDLTGTIPHSWETSARFVHRALKTKARVIGQTIDGQSRGTEDGMVPNVP